MVHQSFLIWNMIHAEVNGSETKTLSISFGAAYLFLVLSWLQHRQYYKLPNCKKAFNWPCLCTVWDTFQSYIFLCESSLSLSDQAIIICDHWFKWVIKPLDNHPCSYCQIIYSCKIIYLFQGNYISPDYCLIIFPPIKMILRPYISQCFMICISYNNICFIVVKKINHRWAHSWPDMNLYAKTASMLQKVHILLPCFILHRIPMSCNHDVFFLNGMNGIGNFQTPLCNVY